MEILHKVFTTNPNQFLLYFRLSMYYALCLLDLQNYEEAELSLFGLTEVFFYFSFFIYLILSFKHKYS